MKTLLKSIFIVALLFSADQLLYAQQDNKTTAKEERQGWQLLFNGQNFDGWRGVNQQAFPEKGWKVTNGTIVCTGEKGGSVITKEKYGDFELKWDWQLTTPGSNSGLKYFVVERPGDSGGYGYGIEYQLLDDKDYVDRGQMEANDFHTTGAAYELYPPSPDKKVNPPGKWNSSRIVSKNGKVEHWLNGKKILDYDRFSDDFKEKVAESKFKDVENYGVHPEGHILLQDHNSPVYFKNIKIRKL